MPDMLVKLYDLPELRPYMEAVEKAGFRIRRANPWEQSKLAEFIKTNFSQGWAEETSVAFAKQPITAFIALEGDEIVGFAAYECTRRNFFGPTGVKESLRGKGLGQVLLVASMWALWELGYGYCIIGGVGPADFYHKTVGAELIPGSKPGIYRG